MRGVEFVFNSVFIRKKDRDFVSAEKGDFMKSGVVIIAAFGVCWAVLVGYLVFLNFRIAKLEKHDGE